MAKKKNTKRKLVGLVSEETGHRTYYTVVDSSDPDKTKSWRKYDPIVRKHVTYTITKKNLGRNVVKERKH